MEPEIHPPSARAASSSPGSACVSPASPIGSTDGLPATEKTDSPARRRRSQESLPPPSRVLFLGGPTAAGKSELAMLLAEKLGGEIISVDSMQVYRGLDIGTAKPRPAERARVPHHLID